MPVPRAVRTGPRTDMPAAASCLAPFVIFSIALFAVWQVNHHTQLEGMVHEVHTQGDKFITGDQDDVVAGVETTSTSTSTEQLTSPITMSSTTRGQDGSSVGKLRGVGAVNFSSSNGNASVTIGVPAVCHMEPHAEYHGAVVMWGDKNNFKTPSECCEACQKKASEGCNIWVYCDDDMCGPASHGRPRGECWLKQAPLDEALRQRGKGHPGIGWSSGVLFTDAEFAAYEKRAEDAAHREVARIEELKNREDLPLVWLEVTLKGKVIGKMEFVLFTDKSPLAAENMRRMCTGEISPQHTLKGATFYRIIDQFIDQTGVEINPCALGGMFKDDPDGLKLEHDRKGLLSVANMGHDTNTGHFSILMGPAPHLNKAYVIFGEMVSGWEVAVEINKLSQGQPNNEILHSPDAVISNVGQTRRGKPVPEAVIKAGLIKGGR